MWKVNFWDNPEDLVSQAFQYIKDLGWILLSTMQQTHPLEQPDYIERYCVVMTQINLLYLNTWVIKKIYKTFVLSSRQ